MLYLTFTGHVRINFVQCATHYMEHKSFTDCHISIETYSIDVGDIVL